MEMHDRDIVNRIRKNRECLAPSIMDEAADEIERLERANINLTVERDVALSRAMTKEQEAHDLRKKSEKAHWELHELKSRYNRLILLLQEYEARDVGGEA
jgi:hypothetical protein